MNLRWSHQTKSLRWIHCYQVSSTIFRSTKGISFKLSIVSRIYLLLHKILVLCQVIVRSISKASSVMKNAFHKQLDYFPRSIAFLGCLSVSIHGTKELGVELATNLELFKKSHYASTNHCSASPLFPWIEYLKCGRTAWNRRQFSNETISEEDAVMLDTKRSSSTYLAIRHHREKMFLSRSRLFVFRQISKYVWVLLSTFKQISSLETVKGCSTLAK